MSPRRGRPPHPDQLTPAEWRVVEAVRHGASNPAIARRYAISLDAVKYHVANALQKLGLSSRRQLRLWSGVAADSALAAARKIASKADPSAITQISRPQARPDPAAAALQPPHQEAPTMHPDTAVINLGAIGQIARSVRDIDEAIAWYRDSLGLPFLYRYGNLAFFDCGGTRLFLSAGDGGPAASILYFRVADIHAAQTSLSARGVVFTHAPHMIHRHADGSEEWMAFFADPEGRPLALMALMAAGS